MKFNSTVDEHELGIAHLYDSAQNEALFDRLPTLSCTSFG